MLAINIMLGVVGIMCIVVALDWARTLTVPFGFAYAMALLGVVAVVAAGVFMTVF